MTDTPAFTKGPEREIMEVMARARWNAAIDGMNAAQPPNYEKWPHWDGLPQDSTMRAGAIEAERRFLASLSAAGYVVVPREPDDAAVERLKAILFSGNVVDTFMIRDLYKAAAEGTRHE